MSCPSYSITLTVEASIIIAPSIITPFPSPEDTPFLITETPAADRNTIPSQTSQPQPLRAHTPTTNSRRAFTLIGQDTVCDLNLPDGSIAGDRIQFKSQTTGRHKRSSSHGMPVKNNFLPVSNPSSATAMQITIMTQIQPIQFNLVREATSQQT